MEPLHGDRRSNRFLRCGKQTELILPTDFVGVAEVTGFLVVINYLLVVSQGWVDSGSGAQLGIRRATSWTPSSCCSPWSTCPLVEEDPEVDSQLRLTLLLRKDMDMVEMVRLLQPMEVNMGKVVSNEALTPALQRLPHRRLA